MVHIGFDNDKLEKVNRKERARRVPDAGLYPRMPEHDDERWLFEQRQRGLPRRYRQAWQTLDEMEAEFKQDQARRGAGSFLSTGNTTNDILERILAREEEAQQFALASMREDLVKCLTRFKADDEPVPAAVER